MATLGATNTGVYDGIFQISRIEAGEMRRSIEKRSMMPYTVKYGIKVTQKYQIRHVNTD